MKLKLYHYWRSSASWRVRWALALKNIPCEFVAIDLLKGEQKSEAHLKRNPLGTVPVLEISEGKGSPKFLGESLAILEWLEEISPKPALLPDDAYPRARVWQLAEIINSGTHPLQNLGARKMFSSDEAKQKEWGVHWTRKGFAAYEKLSQQTAGKFSFGDAVTLADLCLIPQCYNAKRLDISLQDFPTIAHIYAAALETPACQTSHPDRFQP